MPCRDHHEQNQASKYFKNYRRGGLERTNAPLLSFMRHVSNSFCCRDLDISTVLFRHHSRGLLTRITQQARRLPGFSIETTIWDKHLIHLEASHLI